jgi:hypothetical protein
MTLFFQVPLSWFFFVRSLLMWLVSAVGLWSFDLSTLFCTQVFRLSTSHIPHASLSPTLPRLRSSYLGSVTHSLSNSKVQPPLHLYRVTAHDYLNRLVKEFNNTVKEACRKTLKPKCTPDPRGAAWWSEECMRAHILARNARDGIDRQEATKALCMALMKVKKKWAHDCLHKVEDARDIWHMTQIYKGRNTNLFPAMRDSNDNPVTEPKGKAMLFHQRFFPTHTRLVNTIQHDDLPPLDTQSWANITVEEITEALRMASTKSALGPSGIGYTILKWAYAARPEALTNIFNLYIETGKHLWNEVTIVVLNKPQKPDYSIPKAYQPISLLECTGKMLEKIVANRINTDILNHDILPPTQFGSRPHHNTVDAVATLVHRIQATKAANCVGALLLFDISGFFNNLNPERMAQLFHDKGFPLGICQWVLQFMTNHKAILKIEDYMSKPFHIIHGTPQGSPLSSILSALYTANLLNTAKQWEHSDLTMYINDRAIYTTSRMMNAAAMKARDRFHDVLEWLYWNGLDTNLAKTELMMFKKWSAN